MKFQEYIAVLKEGESVRFRPRGNSMSPKIESGQLITVSPVDISQVKPDDIVFCKVRGKYYVHLVSAIQGNRLQISNNKGHVNGWIGANSVFGKVVKVEN